MREDFHYYATYCASYIAGYSHDESLAIAYSAQFVDCCTKTLLIEIDGPLAAATTQMTSEMADERTDIIGLQNITRIWSSFHFLPQDLYLDLPKKTKRYRNKRRLVCGPNGDLVVDTVCGAKNKSLQAVGVAMHVLADTWSHMYFAGTPSLVINNINDTFYDVRFENGEEVDTQMKLNHNPASPDDMVEAVYTISVYSGNENSIMNLGHGRAGHMPDISALRYKYLPAWGDYDLIYKDNPSDYFYAFCQMVYAMKYLRGDIDIFEKDKYATEAIAPYEEEIKAILEKRQLIATEDWKNLAEKLSGQSIKDFDIAEYQEEYKNAAEDQKDNTFLGQFILAALRQKSMVTNRIYKSGNNLAGFSVEYSKSGLRGIEDYFALAKHMLTKK